MAEFYFFGELFLQYKKELLVMCADIGLYSVGLITCAMTFENVEAIE